MKENNLENICDSYQETEREKSLTRRIRSILNRGKRLIIFSIAAGLLLTYSCFWKPYTNISKNRKLNDVCPIVLPNRTISWASGHPGGLINRIYIKSLIDRKRPKEIKIPNLKILWLDRKFAYSPDGKKIYMRFKGYSSEPGNERIFNDIHNIWEIEIDSGKIRKITKGNGMKTHPAISPDGKTIVYRWITEDYGIYIQDLEDGEPKKLTYGFYPSWTPKGEGIGYYYDTDPEGTRTQLWYISKDGKTKKLITEFDFSVSSPALSPDGEKIVFDYGGIGKEPINIRVTNIDGSNPINVTNSRYNSNPVWSDNNTIVYEKQGLFGDIEIVMQKVPSVRENSYKK